MSNQTKLLWIDNGKGEMVNLTSSVKKAYVQRVPVDARRETFLHFILDFEAAYKPFFFSKGPGEYSIKFIDLEERRVYEGKWGAMWKAPFSQELLVSMSRCKGSTERPVKDSDCHELC